MFSGYWRTHFAGIKRREREASRLSRCDGSVLAASSCTVSVTLRVDTGVTSHASLTYARAVLMTRDSGWGGDYETWFAGD
jgi:hypothetical protein